MFRVPVESSCGKHLLNLQPPEQLVSLPPPRICHTMKTPSVIHHTRESGSFDPLAASVTLARAFQDDLLYAALFPNERKRAERLPWLLGAIARYTHEYGEVWTTSDHKAVACWLGPDRTILDTLRLIQFNGLRGARYLGPQRLRKLLRFGDHLEREHEWLSKQPHYYLLQLASDPLCKGRGLGRALVAPMLERADRERLPCYLETKHLWTVKFYESMGFELRHEVPLKDLGAPCFYTMYRPSA